MWEKGGEVGQGKKWAASECSWKLVKMQKKLWPKENTSILWCSSEITLSLIRVFEFEFNPCVWRKSYWEHHSQNGSCSVRFKLVGIQIQIPNIEWKKKQKKHRVQKRMEKVGCMCGPPDCGDISGPSNIWRTIRSIQHALVFFFF